MLDKVQTRLSIIIIVLVTALYLLWPTYQLYGIKNSSDNIDYIKSLEKDAIGLGLDLKGGLRIILELDNKTFLQRLIKQNLSKQSTNQFEKILEESLNNSIRNQSDLILELNNLVNKEKIKLNKFFSNLSKSSDNQEIIDRIYEQKSYAMLNILEVMRNRIHDHDKYGVGEPSIQSVGDDRLVVELAGITDINRAKDYIQRTADFELTLVKDQNQLAEILGNINIIIKEQKNKFIEFDFPDLFDSLLFADPTSPAFLIEEKYYKLFDSFLNNDNVKQIIPNTDKIVWENNYISFNLDLDDNIQKFRRLYLVSSRSAISAGMIQTPKAVVSDIGNDNAGQWVVNLDMTKEGRKKWSNFTARNINKPVAIIMDNKVFMAPYIRDKITSGSTQISGFDSMEEAKDIAAVLKAGELPAPIQVIQTSYVGPSLGEDSIIAGTKAMVVGLACVLLFMLLYYKFSGLIACLALIMNLIIVLAVLVTMNAVLTLPGIAGLILTVGMTVDANVIIFERIKEEIQLGRSARNAIMIAYDKAFVTIFDANITTLLTAFALSFIGSGPIRGFATTLSVGIICSMFTAIFVTKTMFILYSNRYSKVSS